MVAEQAAELERLQREVVRLRAAVIVRDTRLEQAHVALEDARQAQPPGLPRRKEMARHIRMLAERVASLSRECLRWRLQVTVQDVSEPAVLSQDEAVAPAAHPMPAHQPPHALEKSLAAADLVTDDVEQDGLANAFASLGLTQADVALAAGVGLRFVVELEAGKTTVRLNKVLQVVQALGARLGMQGVPLADDVAEEA